MLHVLLGINLIILKRTRAALEEAEGAAAAADLSLVKSSVVRLLTFATSDQTAATVPPSSRRV